MNSPEVRTEWIVETRGGSVQTHTTILHFYEDAEFEAKRCAGRYGESFIRCRTVSEWRDTEIVKGPDHPYYRKSATEVK